MNALLEMPVVGTTVRVHFPGSPKREAQETQVIGCLVLSTSEWIFFSNGTHAVRAADYEPMTPENPEGIYWLVMLCSEVVLQSGVHVGVIGAVIEIID